MAGFTFKASPKQRSKSFFDMPDFAGADRATWTRSQFVRMPDGKRDNGNRQTIFFLNFKPMEMKQ